MKREAGCGVSVRGAGVATCVRYLAYTLCGRAVLALALSNVLECGVEGRMMDHFRLFILPSARALLGSEASG